MGRNLREILTLPDKFSKIFTGIFLNDGNEIVTGHLNGYVSYWRTDTNEPDILLRTNSQVNSIVQSPEGDLFVGCNAGDLYRLYGHKFSQVERILPPTNTKFTRIFRLFPFSNSSILYTSTYGEVTMLSKEEGNWTKKKAIQGHKNGVFSMAMGEDNLFATGDYRGNIFIWKINGTDFKLKDCVAIDSYVSGLSFLAPEFLVALGSSGSINIFEVSKGQEKWRNSFETDLASGKGISLANTEDRKFIFAATQREILRISSQTQEVYYAEIKNPIVMRVKGNDLFVITKTGMSKLLISDFSTKLDSVSYQYFKIGLLGETYSGKSTLCKAVVTGNTEYQGSTFGRHIWTWDVATDHGNRKIIFNDNAGQEQVANTMLPLVADSDIILFFFKLTSAATFRTALDLHSRILPLISSRTRNFLVETFTDDQNSNIRDSYIESKLKEDHFEGLLKVSPINIEEVQKFKEDLITVLDWSQARTALQSVYVSTLTETIDKMRAEKITITDADDIMKRFEELAGRPILKYHLRFLLQNLSDSGVIEFYPNIEEKVVIDDIEFNKLRSKIPVIVEENNGIVKWEDIEDDFIGQEKYIAMLDEFYTSNSISIRFNDEVERVFPARLIDRKLKIDQKLRNILSSGGKPLQEKFHYAGFDLFIFLSGLKDLSLEVVDVSRNEGIFKWGPKAYLYYNVLESSSILEGSTLEFSYKVVGTDKFAEDRLRTQFKDLLVALYGEPKKDLGVDKN
jgi:GTPase SAR1 family protein